MTRLHTRVDVAAELFPGFGSEPSELTHAVLRTVLRAGAVTLTTTVIAAEAPGARVPSEHETLPVPPAAGDEQFPWLVDVLTNRLSGGS